MRSCTAQFRLRRVSCPTVPGLVVEEIASMDHRPDRLEALEHQVQTLHQQTRTVARQLRWWRGLVCGVVVLALLPWALPSTTAQEDARGGQLGLADRVAALEKLLDRKSTRLNSSHLG